MRSAGPIHMRVFVAGATGAVGKRLVPMLVARGHAVTGMTHSAGKADALRAVGAEPVVADGLDRAAVIDAVGRARPDAVVHQMTALARLKSLKNFDSDFALTNRLRTEGTDHLLEAARAAGARRFVAQSYGNWNYEPIGSRPKTEQDPLIAKPPARQRKSLEALRHLENAVTGPSGLAGIALRYGNLYGPGTGIGRGGVFPELLRKRQFPIVGEGTGVWSFLHVDDAASANVAAVEGVTSGVYNACDDEPARVEVWLPELARDVGAPPPRRIPVWLARLVVGEVGVSMMTRMRGASNAKARRELDWTPRWTSWREGFRDGLG